MDRLAKKIIQNRLLLTLTPPSYDAIFACLRPVDLPVKFVMVETRKTTSHLYFIEDGIASVVAENIDGEQAEIANIGFEGVTGASVCLGPSIGETKTFMQASGFGYCITADDLAHLVTSHPSIRELLLKYLYTLQVQIGSSALSNTRYTLKENLARWILMSHDRLRKSDLPLTHTFLSVMLGVRRAGVTEGIHRLEEANAIKASRGNIQVIDREQLIQIAGACYGYPERVYDETIGKMA